jgi:hypothetical protein
VNASKSNFLLAANQTIAHQVATLPLVTPAAGMSFVFDKSLGVFVASNDSFGPIFSERASTIGRRRLGLGFSYQYMNFDALDGIDLRAFPTLFVQSNPCDPVQSTCSIYTHDFITASNRIGMKINQYTAFITFGITRRIDISAAVPVVNASFSAAADASIVPNSSRPGELSFDFSPPSHGTCLRTLSSALNPNYCSESQFSNSQRSSGIGDSTFRFKDVIKTWKTFALAAGFEVRVPSGDEKNLLGSGAIGIRPMLIVSRPGRISPHANASYQWNGESILAGSIVAGNPDDKTKHNLPAQALYSAGVELGMTRRLTATIDLVGQTVVNASRTHLVQALAPGLCESQSTCVNPGQPIPITTVESYTGTYSANDASLGLRFLPFGRLLVSASVLLKLDNGGLRSTAIPVVSVTQTF